MRLKLSENSSLVALIAIFASSNVVCDSLMSTPSFFSYGVWSSWIFISVPITGIILGPFAGFFSSLIGVMIGHVIYFRDVFEFLYTFGAPIGTIIAALVFRGKWKVVLLYYLVLLGAFFATPISWQLPLWGMWDVYVAFGLIFIVLFFEIEIAIAALVFLVFGDMFGKIFGLAYGRHKIFEKTLEGTLAYIGSVIMFGFIIYTSTDIHIIILISGGIAAPLIELLPIGINDNFTVPIISGAVMTATKIFFL